MHRLFEHNGMTETDSNDANSLEEIYVGRHDIHGQRATYHKC
jgi:hypothetical protein